MQTSSSRFCLSILTVLLVVPACSGPTISNLGPTLVPGATAFDPRLLQGHLDGLSASPSPTTGSTGIVSAATYAAEIFAMARLQPMTAGEYRQVWFGPLNRASDAAVARLGRDTLVVRSGITLQADGRSDRGRVEAPSVWRTSAGRASAPAPSPVAWLVEADTTTEALAHMAETGVRAVLVPGDRHEPVAREPVRGLLVVGVAPDVLDRLFPGAPAEGIVRRPLAVEVASAYDPASPVVGVAGLVPGRDPWAREDLVVVAGPLDVAPGEPSVEAAAVLEAARVLGERATRGSAPAATTLFVLWSGSRQGGTGAGAWARNPGWEVNRIRRIVVAGAVPEALTRLERETVALESRGEDGDPVERAARLAQRLLAAVDSGPGPAGAYLPVPKPEP